GGVPQLGRLPHLDPLTGETLRDAMVAGFDLALIAGGE
ncbi:MAG: ATP-dependent dethiobiotin synthetase BioD, partial [Mesorhizobium sp.]